jgi:hypothetical protein
LISQLFWMHGDMMWGHRELTALVSLHSARGSSHGYLE